VHLQLQRLASAVHQHLFWPQVPAAGPRQALRHLQQQLLLLLLLPVCCTAAGIALDTSQEAAVQRALQQHIHHYHHILQPATLVLQGFQAGSGQQHAPLAHLPRQRQAPAYSTPVRFDARSTCAPGLRLVI
jgi:hypothetical protein